jgi:hypothetical protein
VYSFGIPRVFELALGVAWLVSSGRRTRQAIEEAVERRGPSLAAALGSEPAVRTHVDRLSP